MSDRRQKAEYKDRHALRNAGWDVSKTDSIQFNSGSETFRHACVKLAAGFYLKTEIGYRVDSEVEMPAGEVDVLAYGHPDRRPIVVEVETGVKQSVIDDKLERYVKGEPVRDMFVLDPTQVSENVLQALEYAKENL